MKYAAIIATVVAALGVSPARADGVSGYSSQSVASQNIVVVSGGSTIAAFVATSTAGASGPVLGGTGTICGQSVTALEFWRQFHALQNAALQHSAEFCASYKAPQ